MVLGIISSCYFLNVPLNSDSWIGHKLEVFFNFIYLMCSIENILHTEEIWFSLIESAYLKLEIARAVDFLNDHVKLNKILKFYLIFRSRRNRYFVRVVLSDLEFLVTFQTMLVEHGFQIFFFHESHYFKNTPHSQFWLIAFSNITDWCSVPIRLHFPKNQIPVKFKIFVFDYTLYCGGFKYLLLKYIMNSRIIRDFGYIKKAVA